MDLDLAEYDQIDEIKFLENNDQSDSEGSTKYLVTLSSCSNQVSFDDANCENDFVLLPPPSKTTSTKVRVQNNSGNQRNEMPTTSPDKPTQSRTSSPSKSPLKDPIEVGRPALAINHAEQPSRTRLVSPQYSPLITINSNISAHNPFGNYQQVSLAKGSENTVIQRQPLSSRPELSLSKPTGLLEMNSTAFTNPNKLAELMQQIVTRSDSILIAIPCAYCHELITCPPSDISAWLNHMNKLHNCKVCPMCDRMIGLGPRRDLGIMRTHVIEHLDDAWLEQRATKISFSQGLQQHWFLGSRCNIRDPRFR